MNANTFLVEHAGTVTEYRSFARAVNDIERDMTDRDMADTGTVICEFTTNGDGELLSRTWTATLVDSELVWNSGRVGPVM